MLIGLSTSPATIALADFNMDSYIDVVVGKNERRRGKERIGRERLVKRMRDDMKSD